MENLINLNSYNTGNTLDLVDGSELLKKGKKIKAQDKYIIDNLLERGLNLLVGEPKSGKTFLGQYLAEMIAHSSAKHKLKIFGNTVFPGKVLYISTETTLAELGSRFAKYKQKASKNIKYCYETSPTYSDIENFLITSIRGGWIHNSDNVLIVIDSLKDFDFSFCDFPKPLDINNFQDVSKIMKRFSELSDRYNCSFLFQHHLNKNNNSDPLQRIMGSQGFKASVHCMLGIERESLNTYTLAVMRSFYCPKRLQNNEK